MAWVGRNDDDRALIERCVAREPLAWREFVDRFSGTIRAIGRRYLKLKGQLPDDAELDDVCQEVFLDLTRHNYKKLKNYDPTYTPKTYLGVITRTVVHRTLRKRKPALGNPEDMASATSPVNVEGEVMRAEERDEATRALAALPERERELIRLRYLLELDYKGISARLGIPEASVGQLLFRAKQRLREHLKGILGILV
jgi:RNA polymerase sigma-70 factor (ECF subfamily)